MPHSFRSRPSCFLGSSCRAPARAPRLLLAHARLRRSQEGALGTRRAAPTLPTREMQGVLDLRGRRSGVGRSPRHHCAPDCVRESGRASESPAARMRRQERSEHVVVFWDPPLCAAAVRARSLALGRLGSQTESAGYSARVLLVIAPERSLAARRRPGCGAPQLTHLRELWQAEPALNLIDPAQDVVEISPDSTEPAEEARNHPRNRSNQRRLGRNLPEASRQPSLCRFGRTTRPGLGEVSEASLCSVDPSW